MDTAVLDAQGTAAAPEAPPESFDFLPETAPDPAPETAPADVAPETPEGEPDEGRTFTAAELEAAREEATKRERANWEKWQAETKAKAEREAELRAYQQNQQVADRNRQGVAYQYLTKALKDAYDQGKDLPPEVVANAAQALAQGAKHDGHTAIGGELWQAITRLAPDYKPSATIAQQAADAARRYDYVGMAAAQFAMAVEIGEQRARARAEAEAAAKVQQAKPPVAPKRTPGPTNVQGDTGKPRDPAGVLAAADPKSPEYRKAFVAKYGFEP